MKKNKLPIWLNKKNGEAQKLQNATYNFWTRTEKWLNYAHANADALTCDEKLLFLLAYERDITRLNNEPIELFRKRIKYAYANAKDAGEVAGFYRIFNRLDIELKLLLERQKNYDWDVIILRFSDKVFSKSDDLLYEIVRKYGRTCKRYFFEIVHETKVPIRAGRFNNFSESNGIKFEPIFNYQLKPKLKTGSFTELKNH